MSVATPVLTTKRLILRPFEESDYPFVYQWCSSPLVTKFLFWYPHRDATVSKRLVSSWVKKRRNYSWALEKDIAVIGEIEVIKDLPDGGVELGYTLSSDEWGKGFMKEALTEVILFLFNIRKAEYVYCESDARNENSKGLLKAMGFTFLGTKPYFIAKKNEEVELACFRKDKTPNDEANAK